MATAAELAKPTNLWSVQRGLDLRYIFLNKYFRNGVEHQRASLLVPPADDNITANSRLYHSAVSGRRLIRICLAACKVSSYNKTAMDCTLAFKPFVADLNLTTDGSHQVDL